MGQAPSVSGSGGFGGRRGTAWAGVSAMLPVAALMLGTGILPGEASDPPLPGAPVEDPRGDALRAFQTALDRTSSGGLARIIHIGDSHVASDAMTGTLRRGLQERFGDGGPGLVVPGSPWPAYRRRGVETGGDGWTATRITKITPAEGPIGLTGVVMSATEPGATAWVESKDDGIGARASVVELHYLRAPGGGRLQVQVDGAVRANLTTGSSRVEPAFWSADLDDGPHRVELVATGGGTVRVLGLSMTRNAGVVYDALGVNGARFVHWHRADEAVVAAEMRRDPPALVVTTFGTNETNEDTTLEGHRRDFLATIGMLRRAAPGASCLVVGPPDRAERALVERRRVWQTTPALAAIIAAERQAALESGCAFWNTYAAMGGRGTMRRWAVLDPPLAGDDRVHLTSSGYRLIADALATALLGTR